VQILGWRSTSFSPGVPDNFSSHSLIFLKMSTARFSYLIQRHAHELFFLLNLSALLLTAINMLPSFLEER
jgi:hypothetical protein